MSGLVDFSLTRKKFIAISGNVSGIRNKTASVVLIVSRDSSGFLSPGVSVFNQDLKESITTPESGSISGVTV